MIEEPSVERKKKARGRNVNRSHGHVNRRKRSPRVPFGNREAVFPASPIWTRWEFTSPRTPDGDFSRSSQPHDPLWVRYFAERWVGGRRFQSMWIWMRSLNIMFH